jgi:hypothetical protein
MSLDAASLSGAKIASANSSLSNLAIALEDGRGISLVAAIDDGELSIDASIVQAKDLPALSEAVCSVDWTWIKGSVIKQATASSKIFKLHLDPAGPLTVSVAVWQGSPFLSFMPFRAPT